MPFEPDIVVVDSEAQAFVLLAEVKMTIPDFVFTESQLKWHMVTNGVPVGLLVTPQRLWIYRDRYRGPSEPSVERIGEFDVAEVLKFDEAESQPNAQSNFMNRVLEWLDSLTTETGLRALPSDFRRAAERHIVPALSHGVVRAGLPRIA